jgi:hypothetical protein
MKKTLLSLAAAAGASILLTGCLVPEKFTANIDVQKTGAYAFNYSGTMVNALALMDIKSSGKLTEKSELALRADADKIKKDPEVKSISYLGGGRYKLDYAASREPGKPLKFIDTFKVVTGKDGVTTISSIEMSARDRQELESLGLSIDGNLSVKLPGNAVVISQNATSTPILGFGSYSWKIGKVSDQPVLKFKLK